TRIKRLDKRHLVTSGAADMRPSAWHIREGRRKHQQTNPADPNDYPMDWRKDTYAQYTEMLEFFNPPPLDVISVHQYPPGDDTPFWLTRDDDYAFALPWTRRASDAIGKPLFVGEFGQKIVANGKEQDALWTKDFLKRVQTESAPISAFWSWEYDAD